MLVVLRFDRLGGSDEEAARSALDALAGCPGFVRGWLARGLDDPEVSVLALEWAGVGAYRRARWRTSKRDRCGRRSGRGRRRRRTRAGMTNPPTDRTSASSGSWEPDPWDRVRRERRRVAGVSVAIVAVAVLASVLIIVLGTGGDEPDPSASPTGTAASTDTAEASASAEASDEPSPDATGYNWDAEDTEGAQGSPEDVVDAYIQALRDADVDAAIKITCGGLYHEAANAKEQNLGVSQDFSSLSAPVTDVEDPDFPTPAPGKLVHTDWKLGSDTVPRVFLAMVVDGSWKACEVGNEDTPPTPSDTDHDGDSSTASGDG